MVFGRLWRSLLPDALRSLLSNRPRLSSGWYGTGTGMNHPLVTVHRPPKVVLFATAHRPARMPWLVQA
jgi:hypothetical protein